MKFLFLIVFVIFINTVKSQSTTQILRGCELSYGFEGSAEVFDNTRLVCRNFQHTYLPYIEEFKHVNHTYIYGSFNELVIDPAFENLEILEIESTSLWKFEFKHYASFTKLSYLEISGSEEVVYVYFTGAEKLIGLQFLGIYGHRTVKLYCESFKSSNLKQIALSGNNLESFDFSCVPRTMEKLQLENNRISTLHFGSLDSQSCENMKKLSNLTYLSLNRNRLTDFNFACLPQNLVHLNLIINQISTITNESCQFLKNQTSLRVFHLKHNNLQHFQFGCLPRNVQAVYLTYNYITEINDLSDIPHSQKVALDILSNPIRCTCSLLRDFVQLLDSGNVYFYAHWAYRKAIFCANTDSELANYPWNNNATDIRSHDASSLGCLTSGENTDTGVDNNDNTTN